MRKFNLRHLSIRFFRFSFLLFLSIAIVISYIPIYTQASINSIPQQYFVSVNGDDSHLGTEDNPWRTIQYGINQLQAGDTLYIRSGTYDESIIIDKKGSESSGFITIQAYPGEKPVISGKNVSSNRLISFSDAHYIIFDGFEIKDYVTEDSSSSLNGIRIFNASSNIYIQNNYIHHIEHRSNVKANANAIKVNGDNEAPIRNINIINNRLNDLVLGSSEAITIVGNVDGFLVADNVLSNINNIGIDIAGFYGTCESNCEDQPRNGLITRNNVSYIDTILNPMYKGGRSAAAIYVDGGRDTVIDGNIVSYSNFGFSISSEKSNVKASGIILRNNIMYKNHRAGLVIGGSGSSNGGATDNFISNNNFILNNTINDGYGEVTFQHHTVNNSFVNNIFYTSSVTPYIHHARSTSYNNTFDHNIYYTENGKMSSWIINDVGYKSFQQYQSVSGQDKNSSFVNPLFEDISTQNFKLNKLSTAIDSGQLKSNSIGAVDYYGNSRIVGSQIDIGAIEFDSPRLEVPESPLPTSTPIPEENEENEEIESKFEIDGFLDEWTKLPVLASGSKNLNELKATVENKTLYVSVKGKLLKEKGQLYLYLPDSNKQTFNVPHWSNKQAHYLIENGILYEYTGKGGDWSWSKVKSLTREQVVINNGAIEYAITLEELNSPYSNKIYLGYIWKDTKGDQLPNGGQMLLVNTDQQAPTPLPTLEPAPTVTPLPTLEPTPTVTPLPTLEPTPTITPLPTLEPTPTVTPLPTPIIISIDGAYNDWEGIAVWDEYSDISFKATNDSEYIYFYIKTDTKISKDQFYLNTDNNTKTGHQNSVWDKGSGVDYLVEKGILYKYSGNLKNWSYAKQFTLSSDSYQKTSNTIELKMALSQFNLESGNKITLGFILNDVKKQKLPQDAKLKAYVIK